MIWMYINEKNIHRRNKNRTVNHWKNSVKSTLFSRIMNNVVNQVSEIQRVSVILSSSVLKGTFIKTIHLLKETLNKC